MAFPANYNFSYYRGDTLEFRLFPKNNAGAPFNLEGYQVAFTISTARGSGTEGVQAYSAIDAASSVSCAIRPEDSLALPTATSYVYDVEIRKSIPGQLYPIVYTILTGTISVEEQVTDIESTPELVAPGAPTNLSQIGSTSSTISISWDPPTTGGAASGYIVGYSLLSNPLIPIYSLNITASIETFEFTELEPNTEYVVGVAAINAATIGTPTPVTIVIQTELSS